VLKAAIMNGVRRVVCLSTDKADYPINAMGISMAMMEKVMAPSRATSIRREPRSAARATAT
jgi:UDP-N-acetylglucosamine 4,6-dehydratase